MGTRLLDAPWIPYIYSLFECRAQPSTQSSHAIMMAEMV